jgi:tetratricopeptide (TPR) repeat protein
MLTARREAAQAIAILTPFLQTAGADIHLHTAHGMALKALGRLEEAIEAYRRAMEAAPASGVAEHNLAGVLGDAHRFAESQMAARRAFAKGLDAPETWLVHARSLQGLGQFDEAEDAFREAIRRRPAYGEAHADLAQLVWMRTEDATLACEALDQALRSDPANGPLSLAKAKLLEHVGDRDGAYALLSRAIALRADPNLDVSAAQILVFMDPHLALTHAERAFAAAPQIGPSAAALCVVNLALGRAEIAAKIAEDLCRDWPHDQYPVALLATAWRILGDPRYCELYDYDRLVLARTIETPPDWPSLDAFLGDLASRLRAMHSLRGHPIGQSLRNGTQTGQSLALSEDPAIKAFFGALDAPLREYILVLGRRDDVLGRRVRDGYRFAGAWSALLRPGGRHVDHLHPMGWISSAFHVELPASVENGHQGWLKFGEPGTPTDPPLPAEHFVKPRAGQVILFPSYMWHGTVPFGGEAPRLAMAFDVVPA